MTIQAYVDAESSLLETMNLKNASLKRTPKTGSADTAMSSELESHFETLTTSGVDSLAIPTCLSKSMPDIYKAVMRPLDLSFGLVREKDEPTDVRRASRHVVRRAIVNAPKAKASVCFVVRRPGCVLCFEQGAALTDLISEFADHQVGAWAVVKEIDVDNDGLLNLYQKHFKFPFFLDEKRALYGALGQRRISLSQTVNLLFGLRRMRLKKRCKDKGIEGNVLGKGASMVLGGVIVFDRRGNIRYAYQDQFSIELPVDEIKAAISQVVDEDTLGKSSSAFSSS
jgi:peroxiredoxin